MCLLFARRLSQSFFQTFQWLRNRITNAENWIWENFFGLFWLCSVIVWVLNNSPNLYNRQKYCLYHIMVVNLNSKTNIFYPKRSNADKPPNIIIILVRDEHSNTYIYYKYIYYLSFFPYFLIVNISQFKKWTKFAYEIFNS